MKFYAVPEQLVNDILQFLGKQPFIEVAPLIGRMGQIREVPPTPLAVVPGAKEE